MAVRGWCCPATTTDGAGDRVKQAGKPGAQAGAPARACAPLARGGGDEVLARVEGQRLRYRESLVGEGVEFQQAAR